MIYSNRLQRKIYVPIEHLNQVDMAELDAALIALPGWPDVSGQEIMALADAGDLNAKCIIDLADEGNKVAQSYKITREKK